MSFLSIAFLAALPLAAAPILLHLFDRRRSVVIHWGAMQFLLEAATRKTSARRFQHWLLLLLRVAAVAALILALARPLAPANWFSGRDRRETVLVIDNSMSTQQRSGEERLFDQLIARAVETVEQLDAGSSVRVLATSPYPAWVTPAGLRVDVRTREQVTALLDELRPTEASSDIPAALLKAVQSELENEKLLGRRVLLLTDGHRHDWRTDDPAGWQRFHEVFENTLIPTTLEVVELNQHQQQGINVAVARLRSNHTVVGVQQPVEITASAHNFSPRPSAACAVTWLLDGEKVGETQLPALQPGEKQELVLHHAFSKQGVYALSCRLDAADDLKTDDSETLVLEVVDRVPVLLVESSRGFAEMQQDAFLVRAALGQIEGDASEHWHAVFEPRTISPERLESLDLSGFQAVVIPNLNQLSDKAVERLTQFVGNGGGLWLALGPRTDIESFNKRLYREGDGLSPVGIARIVGESTDEFRQPTINPFQKQHPATAALADNERLDTGDVKVSRRFRWQMPTDSTAVPVLLDLSNGEPLVVENRVGRGRVIVQAVPLRFQWSELAVSQAFVVMVHNWLGYLTEPAATRHNLLPGDAIEVVVEEPEDMAPAQAVLTLPDGSDVTIAGEPTDSGTVIRTSRTALPGTYSLDLGPTRSRQPFHIAREGAESDLQSLTASDRTLLLESIGLENGHLATTTAQSQFQAPIWPLLLVLLVAVMAIELVLSGVIARKRFGSAPIVETVEHGQSESSISMGLSRGQRAPKRTAERSGSLV